MTLPNPIDSLLASLASTFTQNSRLLRLRFADSAGLDTDVLLPKRLTGEEHLSRCYRYSLECLSADGFLELKDLLGQPASVGILQADGDERGLCGIVTAAAHAGSDGGFSRYTLTIEPALATLTHRTNSRMFQDQSVPDIVTAVLSEHIAANAVFAASFRVQSHLQRSYPARSYCLQYRESDVAFIERLLAEEGISYRFKFSSDGADNSTPVHILILFDDWQALEVNAQERIRFHRADGTESDDAITAWHGARQLVAGRSSLASFDYRAVSRHDGDAETDINQGETADALASTLEQYDPQTLYYGIGPDDMARYAQLRQQAVNLNAKTFTGEGTVRSLQAGTWFRLDDHPVHEQDVAELREFIVTSVSLDARNNLVADDTANDAGAPYGTRFTAVRRGIPIVPAYDPERHARPTASGPQTALVVGPEGEEIFTDEHGRIKVQFHWQRPEDHPDGGAAFDDRSSTWVRVAHSSAGAGWGSQFIPRIGQEVVIEFLEGDIDRPLCTGVIHNGTHLPPIFSGAGTLPANKALSGIQTKEDQGRGYNELLLDDTAGELRTKLSSEHAKTQLNQGYLIHSRTKGKGSPRGDGFELRSDAAGALRAAKGLLLSAEPQASAASNQLARQALLQVLDSALALAEQLGEQATHQHANQPETGAAGTLMEDDAVLGQPNGRGHQAHLHQAMHNLERGSNTDRNGKTGSGNQPGGQQVVAIGGPDGVAVASNESITITSGTNLDQIAQRDTQQATGRRWAHNVHESISLFVAGTKAKISDTFKLIAAKGNIQMQAQDGKLEATAQNDVTITSVNGKIVIQAPKEILLAAGGGYIRIGADIEIHNPGKQSLKAASFNMSAPVRLDTRLPSLPQFVPPEDRRYSLQVDLADFVGMNPDTGHAIKQLPYEFRTRRSEVLYRGVTNIQGDTARLYTSDAQDVVLDVGDGDWTLSMDIKHSN
jgi:type VI secretion system secreted protein VgrG